MVIKIYFQHHLSLCCLIFYNFFYKFLAVTYVLIVREFLVGYHFPFTYGFNIENFLGKLNLFILLIIK